MPEKYKENNFKRNNKIKGEDKMLKLQKNRGGYTECDKCNKEIKYYEDYYWNTDTGEVMHENCINKRSKRK
jgi:hypothetical protein